MNKFLQLWKARRFAGRRCVGFAGAVLLALTWAVFPGIGGGLLLLNVILGMIASGRLNKEANGSNGNLDTDAAMDHIYNDCFVGALAIMAAFSAMPILGWVGFGILGLIILFAGKAVITAWTWPEFKPSRLSIWLWNVLVAVLVATTLTHALHSLFGVFVALVLGWFAIQGSLKLLKRLEDIPDPNSGNGGNGP